MTLPLIRIAAALLVRGEERCLFGRRRWLACVVQPIRLDDPAVKVVAQTSTREPVLPLRRPSATPGGSA